MSETNIEEYLNELVRLADEIEVKDLCFDEELLFEPEWFRDQDDSLFGE